MLRQSDFVTVHMPKTPETTGMISTAQLAAMKSTAYVINVARGGLIDEDALYEALTTGVIAGAGLDVFTSEPPAEGGSAHRLLALPNVVVTPHLGASTDEAQEKAGVSVARSVKLALEGDLVPDAVNVAGGVIDPFVRPGIALVEQLGQFFTALAPSALTSLDIEVRGELAAYDVSVYRLAALKGIFTNIVSENVSYVNAPLFAEQRGIETRLIVEAESPLYRNITILRGTLSDGSVLTVAGTLAGTRMVPKVVGINDYEIEVAIARHHVVMRYADRPGHRGDLRSATRRREHQHREPPGGAPRRQRARPLGAHGGLAGARGHPRRHARGGRRRPVPADRDHRAVAPVSRGARPLR